MHTFINEILKRIIISGGRYYRNIIDTTDTGPVSSSIGIEISRAAVSILRPHP